MSRFKAGLNTVWRFIRNPFTTAQTSAILLLILGFGAATTGYLQQHVFVEWLNILDNPLADFYANASAELISIAITVLIIERSTRKENERERKEELIFLMQNGDNSTALNAVTRLSYKGWLKDGSLHNANLMGSKLSGANLIGANLQEADLSYASLNSANMGSINLQGANLQDADLQYAMVIGANFQDANLKGVILPDGSEWTPEVDMNRFTDMTHRDFWMP